MQQGVSTAPVQSPLEGIARALQGGIGGLMQGYENDKRETRDKTTLGALANAATAGTLPEQQEALRGIQGDPSVLGPVLASMVGQRQQQLQAGQHADAFTAGFGKVTNPPAAGATPTAVAQGDTPIPGIPGFESGNNYAAVGPVTTYKDGTKDQPWGKYQMMGRNIPVWSQEVLGRAWTPQELTANTPEAKAAQDAIYRAKITQYRQQTGSDDGARAMWFSGQPNPNSTARDVNGVNVQQYVQRTGGGPGNTQSGPQMAENLPPTAQTGQVSQPSQVPPVSSVSSVSQGDTLPRADASGTPVPPSSTVPDVPRPQPSPEQVQKYTGMIRDGSMTAAQARTALDQELTQEWTVQRENRRMQWQQQQEDQRVQKKAQIELEQKAPMELISKRMDNYENKVRPATMAAVNEIPVIHQARQILDAGAFTGTGAEAKTFMAKLGEQLGIPSQDAQNTQVLGSVLAKRTLAASGGTLGTGFSNADRDFMENASGGKITLDEGAIRKILDIGERQARQAIAQHDTETKRMAKMPGVAQLGPDYLALPAAPTYEEWSKANPMPQAQGAPQSPQVPQGQPGQVVGKTRDGKEVYIGPDGRPLVRQ